LSRSLQTQERSWAQPSSLNSSTSERLETPAVVMPV
jgi:hypothetical protein